MSDPDPVKGDAKRRGPSAPVIGAIATVLAAVIAGIFTLIATSNSSGNQQAITTIQSPLPSGATESQSQAFSSSGGSNAKYLSDMTPVPDRAPTDSNFTDTIGGRAVVKAVGLSTNSEAEFVIPTDAMRFQAILGLSASSDPDTNGVFTIFGDATELLQQSLNRGYSATVSVSVKGYKVLRLGFTSTSSGHTYGDFGLARFTS